ncbi:cytosol non-specific dipeptidase PepD [Gottschalkia purinilytica]|uniref:Cytosol non-specific dipeptidase n=1 Tax=Gottschalkia purinilytica TaxID=1503 RepID=A0A0L0WFH9_GOTPU|nr:aminoacyl-histidine dipeptidase [Gottschalkia purinilytica]KNF10186.1 cytosol non-specific dipeptidase PepD [Gottschalkia purinilytica]
MNRVLESLEPNSVFKFFEDISRIPRCSGHEKEISDYLVSFAKERGLDVVQDEALNVIIRKSATSGYENSPTIILQGHMDMVCEKNQSTEHDFSKDPIKLRVEDDMIMGTGTTLGADNGIAVAYALAILDSDNISHPPLEVLITSEEETGMGGAKNLDPNSIKGRILINIDSEEEGTLLVSCAGGIRTVISIPIEKEFAKNEFVCYKIKVRGLKGGHSGMEINKERGNSNKILGRILNSLNSKTDIYLSEISGGAKMNAIPREADATIYIKSDAEDKLKNEIDYWNKTFKNELKVSDSDVSIELEKSQENNKEVFTKQSTNKVIYALTLSPNGIQSMSMDIEGLVQSSVNLGVVKTENNKVTLESAVRSSIETLKTEIVDKIKGLSMLLGVEIETEGDYPGWEYNPESYIRDVFVKSYKAKYGKEPIVTAIHAGLECGLFGEKIEGLDMISFGPNMYDVHTPSEKVSISSVQRTWEYLIEVLKSIK